MSWFSDLTTRAKLVSSFALMIVVLAAVVLMAYQVLEMLQVSQRDVVHDYDRVVELVELRSDLNRQRAQMLLMMMTTAPAERDVIETDVRKRSSEIEEGFKDVAKFFRDSTDLRRLEEMKTILTSYRDTRDTQFRLIKADKVEDARKMLDEQENRFEKIRAIALDLGEKSREGAREAVKQSERQASRALTLFVGAGLLAIFMVVILVVILNRLIAGPLDAFGRFVERVGEGDLTQQAAMRSHREDTGDEVTRLGSTLNRMVKGLSDMTGQIRGITQNLNAAAAQIMVSIQEQAASTKEQAATVQQITTTMTEVAQSGAQITEKAKQVAAAAEATSVGSNAGIHAVQESNRTMVGIREQVEEVAENIVALSEKTQAVGEIIVTVNDIAERSNLLALNAAIEAAAAGDQGNRFSVVANEMKNLADQAKASTLQVRTILGDIQKGINSSVMLTEEAVKRVEVGKQQADIAEQTIRQMAKTTLESVQAFDQIIGAGNQQQIGFEQVAQGMKDIRQASTQTAAATSQLERAVADLNTLSQELHKTMGRYKI